MRVAFVTVGDTARRTGGYIYNAKALTGLRERGVGVTGYVASGASVGEQEAASNGFGATFDPSGSDCVVVDMLARVVCADHVEEWSRVLPVVTLVHELPGLAAGDGSDGNGAEDTLLEAASVVITVSEHGRSTLEARGVDPERIRVVPPGFDTRKPPVPSLRRDGVRALCVAQWIPRKGILELVRAWREVAPDGASLLLVGETDADPGYTARVLEETAEDPSIEVAGAVDDDALARAYAEADFFVLPSRFEGYGVVYAEALAAGLPVLAPDVGPVPDLVGKEAAMLIAPDDPASLFRLLRRLLSDGELRRRMSGAALKRAAGLPGWKDTAHGFAGVVFEAVERGRDPHAEQNRRSWNAVVGAHESHRENLADFLAGGGSTLFPEELSLLGDVSAKRVAHLQCNTGADSLSLARLGAKVTGVDISDKAVSSATRLSGKSGIPAEFRRADVYGWLEAAKREDRRFDVVFASYGVVCWLRDLDGWARGISDVLADGGSFVLVEFHPFATIFSEDWRARVPYRTGGEVVVDPSGVGDYVAASRGGLTPAGFVEGVKEFENPEPCRLYNWGLGEVVSALVGAGLRLSDLREYPYSNGERNFDRMRELPGRRMYPPEDVPQVPLMYGIRAVKESR